MLKNQLRRVIACLAVFLIFCAYTSYTFAQDIHFSQFSQSPLYVNPAYTGMFDGNWRFSNNYRNQWSAVGTPYKTISAGFDKPFKLRRGNVGLGLVVLNDQSGSYKLTANKISLSLSYKYNIKDHTLSAGVQAGYIIHTVNTETLTFPGQYNENTGLFDAGLPDNLEGWDENINYADVNMGIAWTSEYNGIIPVAGFSAFHINSPTLSFLREDAKLSPRFAFNAYATIPLKDQWYAVPNIFTSFQKSASDYLVGGIIGYKFPIENLLEKIYFGTEVRTQFHSTDAVVAMIGVGIMGFDIGLSYDVNVSGLTQATNMRGAFELSLTYTNFLSELNRITIPCDRY